MACQQAPAIYFSTNLHRASQDHPQLHQAVGGF
jgi:hypothetical protein